MVATIRVRRGAVRDRFCMTEQSTRRRGGPPPLGDDYVGAAALLTLRLPPNDVKRLEELARENAVTKSSLARQWILEMLNERKPREVATAGETATDAA